MSKMISGAEYPLSKIFSSDFEYHIPQYQRPYAWTEEEAGILFDDLYDFFMTEDEDNYFLGSMVLIKQENSPLAEVIDGQQRLTTLTILLAVLANRMSGEMREACMGYLRESGNLIQGLQAKPRLFLRDTDQEFFDRYIQNLRIDDLAALDLAQLSNESQQHIKANCEALMERVDKKLGDDATLGEFAKFLVNRCYLVAVSTPNQPSAYRVFSVMNSRGLDLLPTDIIKADIIAKIPEEERDDYAKRWEELESMASRDGFENVFAHARMIAGKRKAKRALNEEFRQYVTQPLFEREADEALAAKKLIDDTIDPLTMAYITIRDVDYRAKSHAEDVNRSLAWLNTINNSDWMPVACAFMVEHGKDPAYTDWFFRKLERLAACLLVTGKGVNKRIARYAKVLEEMERRPRTSLADPLKSIELSRDERAEFLDALNGEIYLKTAPVRRYVMLRLDSFISDGAATYEPSVFTIEHVLPQTVKPNSEWARTWQDQQDRAYWLNRIANLVPLNRRRNSSAQNYDFRTKKEKYFSGSANASSYALTTQVLAAPKWTPKSVEARQADLMGVFKREWEL